jgi:hypothetical protein
VNESGLVERRFTVRGGEARALLVEQRAHCCDYERMTVAGDELAHGRLLQQAVDRG